MNEEEEFEFRLRLERESQVEPSLSDKALSYGASALSGLTALPRGGFQLGANIGDYANEAIGDYLPYYVDNEAIELSQGVKEYAKEQNISIPEDYKGGFGDYINREIGEQNEVKNALMKKAGREGFDFAELAGTLPAGFMNLGGKIPLGKAAHYINKLPQYLKNAGQGVKAGAVYGSSMPVTNTEDFGKQKVTQALLGASVGGALPLATEPVKAGGRWLGEVAKPFLGKYGKNLDVNKFIRENFRGASSHEKQHIHKALQEAYPDETSGQAIARYNRNLRKQGIPEEAGGSIVATEKALSRTHEGAASQLKSKPAMQQIEREQILGAISKTGWERKLMGRIIKADDAKKYGAAFKEITKADPKLAKLASNPYFKDQIKTAKKIMESGDNKKSLTEFLHNIKLGLDKNLSIKAGSEHALSAGEKKATLELKKDLLTWLKNKNPIYDDARTTHAANAAPLTRAKVGRELKNALINASDDEASTVFQNAMRNAPRTVKKATGQRIHDDLGKVLKSEEMTGVNIVSESLKNLRGYNKMAAGSQNLLQRLNTEATPQLVHILSRPVVFTNAILKAVGKDMGSEYRKILSEKMSNPEALRKIIEKPDSQMAKNVVEILNYIATTQTAKQAGG